MIQSERSEQMQLNSDLFANIHIKKKQTQKNDKFTMIGIAGSVDRNTGHTE